MNDWSDFFLLLLVGYALFATILLRGLCVALTREREARCTAEQWVQHLQYAGGPDASSTYDGSVPVRYESDGDDGRATSRSLRIPRGCFGGRAREGLPGQPRRRTSRGRGGAGD